MNEEKKRKHVQLAIGIIILISSLFLTIWLWPKIMAFSDPDKRQLLEESMRSYGIGGWLVILGIQVFQVVVAMIPGEPVEIMSGVLYGAIGGTVTCMIGIFMGISIIFALVKKLGLPIVSYFIDPEKISGLWFLRDEKRFERIALLLFFIPGTPKDILTYGVCLSWSAKQATLNKQTDPSDLSKSNMVNNPWRFFILSTIARLPSILTSTLLGSSLIEGNFKTSFIVFLVTGVVSILGILIHNRIVKNKNNRVD